MLSRTLLAVFCAAFISYPGMKAQTSNQQLKWDVISVKPETPDRCKDPNVGGVRYLPNGLSSACAPVQFVVEFAYHQMDPARIVDLPKWTTGGEQMYEIEARVSDADAAAFAKLKREEKAAMMQSVLTERFGMKAHIETRDLPAYSLVTTKSGSKLKESSSPTVGATQFGSSNGEVKWEHAPLTDLLFLLARETGRPVVDNTGLTGKYDFILQYTPSALAATDESGKPSIFTALEEQLGLKLVPSKQPVEVVVVDSIKQPSEN